ncbi:MAG: class I SAM-dependent DNA methyltransferase [Candidatus Thorarchaeota archaeon]
MDRTPDLPKNLELGYEGVAKFYDFFASNDDLPLYLDYAKSQGSPVLDIAAGTGRVSLALAEIGLVVHAVEKSPSMLSIFREKIAEREIARLITIHEGDMTNFSLDNKFPLIIIPSSFGHALTKEQQLSTLLSIKKHLSDDGIFIFDLYVGEHIDNYSTFQDGPVLMPDGREVMRYGEMTLDREKQLMSLTLRFEVHDSSGSVVEAYSAESGTAVINRLDADNLIQDIGFKILEDFGDFHKNPYTPDSYRRILILSH